MWWRERSAAWRRRPARLAVVLAAAGLTAGCFQPLYGTQPSAGDRIASATSLPRSRLPVIAAPKGQPVARIAVALRNALQFDLNGAAGANAPTYRLKVIVGRDDAAVGHRRRRPAAGRTRRSLP